MSSMTGIPLDKREIVDGSSRTTLPALHKMWIRKSRFVSYVPPPQDPTDQGSVGEWLERLEYISTDLHWLLQLSHQKFWCQVIFDESLHLMLDSFLQYSPRPYDDEDLLSDASQKVHDQVSKLVFLTYLRMATYKESKDNWLTPEVFGEIIYENFLFDITKILDLCALYGHCNTALLSKMVGNIFTHQPKYMDDLREAVPTIMQVFVNIAVKCGLEQDASGLTPQKLGVQSKRQVDLTSMENTEFEEVVFYLADTAITLSTFLQVYPQACGVLHDLHFCPHLAHMYEKLIPALENSRKRRTFDIVRHKKIVRGKLQQARHQLLTIFHTVVTHVSLQPLLEEGFKEGGSIYVENFLTLMSAVLGDKRFLADYEGQFSFQEDIDILSQASGEMDEAHYRFIQEAINSAFAAHGKRKKPTGNTNRGGRTSPDGSPCPPSAQSSVPSTAVRSSDLTIHPDFSASAAVKTGVELDSLVYAVKDLLPHLGEGFIQHALEEMNYSVEAVVGAVLEDRLPPALQDLNPTEDRPVSKTNIGEDMMLVNARKNIYDNDAFDVFSNAVVDVQNIHKGKRSETEGILEDKDTIKELRELYEAYGNMDVRSMYEPHLYDDEYDDTYDINNVGADDADSADELTQRRPFTVPQVLRKKAERVQESEESSEEEDEKAKDHFVQDPAKLREMQEQKRAAHYRPRPPPSDVKGKAKGQGQSKEVVHNRQNKDRSKASRANHNRKALADKKQHKGMF